MKYLLLLDGLSDQDLQSLEDVLIRNSIEFTPQLMQKILEAFSDARENPLTDSSIG